MSSHSNRKVKPSTIRARNRNKKIAIVSVIAIVAVVVVAFVMFGLGNPEITPTSGQTTPSPSESVSPSPSSSPMEGPVKVLLETSMGNITIQLDENKPITSENFRNLVEQGKYDDTIFHRVIADFMIQGGAINENIDTIPDEIGTNNRNTRGTIAMAKTNDPDSATSQFFINVVDNGYNVVDNQGTKFDEVYTAFGEVIQGLDVVDAISNVAVNANPYTGELSQPQETITLIRATIVP